MRRDAPAVPAVPAHAAPAASQAAPYRHELHGLRALAIILVAVYHVWFGRVSGGVDVFLFLSAFFLTGTFLRRLELGRPLAVPRYWLRTFKRLLPPAAVVILMTMLGAYLVLPPSLWPAVMNQAVASITYVENFELIRTRADYQARDAGNASPLQHFWSLSIQGQLFLLWPLLFLVFAEVARRFGVRRTMIGVVGVLAAASFVWSVMLTQADQPVAYFHTGARLWEFAAGSLLALVLPWIDRRTGAARAENGGHPAGGFVRALAGWAGVLALLAVGLTIDVAGAFPGWIALWPLGAATLIIVAGHSGRGWGVDRLLSTRLLGFLGDISYALYLVHWPLLVMWLSWSEQPRAGFLDGLAVLTASLLLAWTLTRAVDTPIRRSVWFERRIVRSLTAVAASMALVLTATGAWWAALPRSQDQMAQGAAQGADGDGAALPDGTAVPADEVPLATPATLRPYGYELDDQWPRMPHECSGSLAPGNEFPATRCDTSLPVDAESSGTVVVVGSSRARMFVPALLPWAERNDLRVINLHKDGCVFRATEHQDVAYCEGYYEGAMHYIDTVDASLVMLNATELGGNGEDAVPAGTAEAVQTLLDRSIPVLAVRAVPRWEHDQFECAESAIHDGDTPVEADAQCGADLEHKLSAGSPMDPVADLRGPDASVTTLDLTEQICPDGRCSPILGDTYVYMDRTHLTRSFVESALAPVVDETLTADSPLTPVP